MRSRIGLPLFVFLFFFLFTSHFTAYDLSAIEGSCIQVTCFDGNQYPCGFDCQSLIKGGYSTPTTTPRKPSARELEAEREWATHDANELGIEAYERGDWAAAISYFETALEYDPYNPGIKDNLNAAREKLQEKEARIRNEAALERQRREAAERQRIEAERRAKEAERKAQLVSIEYELLKTENRIKETAQKLKKLSEQLPGYQASMDEWTSLTIKAREEAHQAALDNVATFGLFWLSGKKEKQLELSKDISDRVDGLIKRNFLGQPYYEKLSSMQKQSIEHLGKAKTEADATKILKELKGITGDAVDLSEKGKDRDNFLSGLISVMSLVSKNPKLELLVSDIKLAAADVYAYMAWDIAKKRINQLMELSELQIKEVNSLSRLYKQDIDKRKQLEADKSKILSSSL